MLTQSQHARGPRALIAALLLAACSSEPSGPRSSDAGAKLDAPTPAEAAIGNSSPGIDAAPDVAAAAMLTLALDPSIDQPGDAVKVRSITAAIILDRTGASKTVSAVVDGVAVFDMSSLSPGDFFLEINGDRDDLVPTRIDDPSRALSQRVGQKLRASYIGPEASPTYRINTYSAGQQASFVERFSDGTVISGEQPYVIFSFASSQLDVNVLGTARPLTSLLLARCVGHAYVTADSWLLNTTNQDHHGDLFNADGGATGCASCHWDYWVRKPSFSWITPSNGWCFRCHTGPGGASAGFVDPTQ